MERDALAERIKQRDKEKTRNIVERSDKVCVCTRNSAIPCSPTIVYTCVNQSISRVVLMA